MQVDVIRTFKIAYARPPRVQPNEHLLNDVLGKRSIAVTAAANRSRAGSRAPTNSSNVM